jgi:outer membrane receptor protein involved in Fe transport
MRKVRFMGVSAAALVALAGAGQARAQGAPTPQEEQQAQDDQQEILVTVQRREQTLAQVPQSVSVVGEETLERQNATSFVDYAPLIPGLSLTQENPGESRVIIRGINTNSVGATVSIYVDDIPFGSSGSLINAGVLAGDFDTFDIARVEVLRGPQGTLYGSNALGGTLKFVTVLPEFDAFEARVQGGVELVDEGGTGWSGNAMVNVPLGETLAFRASGFYRRNAGYIDAVGRAGENINDSASYGGRASLLFEPTDALSIRLMAIAQSIRVDSPSSFEADPVTFEPVDVLTGLPSDERTRFERIAELNDVDYRLYNATLNWDFGFANLTSATSYGTLDQRQLSDISDGGERDLANSLYAPTAPGTIGLAFQNDTDSEKFTQELRLASPNSDVFEWQVGAYYTKEEALLFQRFQPFSLATQALLPTGFDLGGVTIPELVLVTLESSYEEIAGFASATWHLSPRFDITAGGRFSHNSQDSEQTSLIVGTAQNFTGESSEDVFTWSIAPRYEINDHASVYARVAKGYRPGGPNAVPPGAPPTFLASFEADTLVSYEVGFRGQTIDNSFSIDASLYRLDWDNILINTIFIDPNTGTQFGANGNGRRARSVGAEVTAIVRPMRGLRAVATLAFIDAELLDDTTPAPGVPNLTGGLAGDRLPYTPEISANLAVDYEWALSGSAEAFVGANIRAVSDQAAGFDQEYRADFGRRLVIDGYETVDLRAGAYFGRYSLSVYVRNLTNSDGLINAGGYPRQIPPVVGGTNLPFATAASLRPRTIGVTVGASF